MEKLDAAISEAERFLNKAKKCKKTRTPNHFDKSIFYFGSKESSAVKRSSMDLTRALADLRRA